MKVLVLVQVVKVLVQAERGQSEIMLSIGKTALQAALRQFLAWSALNQPL